MANDEIMSSRVYQCNNLMTHEHEYDMSFFRPESTLSLLAGYLILTSDRLKKPHEHSQCYNHVTTYMYMYMYSAHMTAAYYRLNVRSKWLIWESYKRHANRDAKLLMVSAT